ncbi:MAG: ABC transporter permease subunit [Lachnospiraceae bacterium]|nr:ABC transporter permease subunit [Lachnospiraceae bacterium]
MRQFTAFVKKEFLEQLRSGKLLILAFLFCLFGIMNPAMARLTPWLMELLSDQLAESGMIVAGVEVNALTSWTQYFKNMPIALMICIVMFSGILTSEYQSGTLIHIVTRGMKRWKILTAKTLIMAVFWTIGSLVCYGITYGYNAYFWDNSVAAHVFTAAFCGYLAGLWLITVIPLASACFDSAPAVVISVGAVYLAGYLAGLIPKLKSYTPVSLMNAWALLAGAESAENYGFAIAVAVALTALHIAAAAAVFNRKNL